MSGRQTAIASFGPQRGGVSHHRRCQRQVPEAGSELVEPRQAELLVGAQQFSADFIVGYLGDDETVSRGQARFGPLSGFLTLCGVCRVAEQSERATVE